MKSCFFCTVAITPTQDQSASPTIFPAEGRGASVRDPHYDCKLDCAGLHAGGVQEVEVVLRGRVGESQLPTRSSRPKVRRQPCMHGWGRTCRGGG